MSNLNALRRFRFRFRSVRLEFGLYVHYITLFSLLRGEASFHRKASASLVDVTLIYISIHPVLQIGILTFRVADPSFCS